MHQVGENATAPKSDRPVGHQGLPVQEESLGGIKVSAAGALSARKRND